MDFINRYKNVLSILILFLIITVGFAVHLYLFSQTKYVNGVDGGFYAYKTREIVEEGIFDFSLTKAPSTPPVLFLTSAFFAKFFGVFNGVKIATSLFSTLLGASLFILTKYVTKSNKAGLIAAFFVIFSPLSLRIAADIRKNTASLFFTPLIIYFMLKFFRNWKYVIPLGITGALGILSHNSIITMWFISLAYLTFKLGIKGKLPLKEFLPIFAANLFIVILFLSFYDKVSSSLSVIATEPGSVYKPFFDSLNTFILPLMITAVPGILLALKRRDSKNIFMLVWLILSFILTLSQMISSKEYWRFLLLMFVPVGLFVGYSFNWLLHKLLYIALPVLLVTGIITTFQFLDFGHYDMQIQPQLDEATLKSLEMASDGIGKSNYVYTNFFDHSYFWVRYYFGINTRQELPGSEVEINELFEQGNDVYIMKGNQNFPSGEGKELDFSFEDENMETVYEDQNVKLYKLIQHLETGSSKEVHLPLYDKDNDFTEEEVEYDFARFEYLSTYLILPYEIINIINPPYLPLWQIQLGFPLSLLLIGFVLSIPFRLKLKVSGPLKYVFVGIGIVIVLIIYNLEPSIFWGEDHYFQDPSLPPEDDMKQDIMTPDDVEKDFSLCGDGICDQSEQANPTLCPKDCK